jgi:hypothetical protein
MTKTKGVIYVAIIAVLLVFWYVRRWKSDARIDAQLGTVALPKEDKAQYIIDVPSHELVEVTRGPDDKEVVKRRFLAPRTKVEIRKDGAVVITARGWGTEVAPFIGAGVDSGGKFRGAVGVNVFYVRRAELGLGLVYGPRESPSVRAFADLSINVYSNTSVFVGLDHKRTAFAGASVKF